MGVESFFVDSLRKNLQFPATPCQEHSSLGEGILKKPFEMDADGFIPVPQGPGLGVEPDEEALETYPKTGEGHLPYWIDRDDGSYAQW